MANLSQNDVDELLGVLSPDAQKPLVKPEYAASIMDRILAQTILPDGSVYTVKDDDVIQLKPPSKQKPQQPEVSYEELVSLLTKGEG